MSRRTIHVITLFPELFQGFLHYGVVGRLFAAKRLLGVNFVRPGDHCPKGHKGVDDTPYGGRPGMAIKADVLRDSLTEGVLKPFGLDRRDIHTVMPDPKGPVFDHKKARLFCQEHFMATHEATGKEVVFICGRYEGIDERFVQRYVDEKISLGDFVLSGGELATMAILDASLRFLPRTLGNQLSVDEDSFENGLLDDPLYTRPALFEGLGVPEVLTKGNHRLIRDYRRGERLRVTAEARPDMLRRKR